MAFITALLATAVLVLWIYLAMRVSKEDVADVLIAKRKNMIIKLKGLDRDRKKKIKVMISNGVDENSKKIKKVNKKYNKKVKESKKELSKYEHGKIGMLDVMPACGYAFMNMMNFDSSGKSYRQLLNNIIRVDGKENASVRTRYIIGSTISNLIIGLMLAFSLTSLFLSLENENAVLLGCIVLFMAIILSYVPLSNIKQAAQYRTERIESEFPNVVSKLAMLINSGMEVSKAWELTAYSNEGVLYDEMKKTVELQNSNVSPVEAYTQFMNNCNNKYTSKLSTSIMQNLSKGNAEIGALFIQLSNESWSERKHNSKRLGEKAQSNLLVPTIMIFAGILVMVIVPIVANVAGSI